MDDPRDRITPDAFSVAPDLLGLPLASHPRRVTAIVVDLALVGLLSQVGWVVLGIAIALLFFRIALRTGGGRPVGRGARVMRVAVGSLGAAVLLVTVVATWGGLDLTGTRSGETPPPGLGFVEFAQGFGEVQRLRAAPDAMEAEARAMELVERLRALGVTDEDELRSFLREIAPRDAPWLTHIDDWTLAGRGAGDAASDTATGGDSAPAALDTVAVLEEALRVESAERLRAERALAAGAREEAGPRAWLRRLAEDLGLGFGWGALYFTLFTTLWKGRTPGKRLLGLRVVRLDGAPISWWAALERYGGYAAGFATGLLGFMQITWDANRQATHDKIAGTVVIRERSPAGRDPHRNTDPPQGSHR